MPRWIGWLILTIAGILVYSLAFTTFEAWTGSWKTTDSGGLVRIYVECPTPFAALVFDAGPEGEEGAERCLRSARTLAIEAGFVALAASLMSWTAVTRPKPEPVDPISLILNPDEDPGSRREGIPDGSGRGDRRL